MDEQIIKDRIKEYLYNSTMRGLLMPKDRYALLDEVEKYNIDEQQLNRWILEVQEECGFATGPSQKNKKAVKSNVLPPYKPVKPSSASLAKAKLKLGPKAIIAFVAAVLVLGLALVYFVVGPEAFQFSEQASNREEDTYYEATENPSSMKEAVAQDAASNLQTKAPGPPSTEEASIKEVAERPAKANIAVANTVEDHLVQISNGSLSYKDREQIASEAMKYFAGENAQVLIYTNGQRTGRESIKDYLDILLLQKYKVTINDKHTNNEGKITQLSVVEQY